MEPQGLSLGTLRWSPDGAPGLVPGVACSDVTIHELLATYATWAAVHRDAPTLTQGAFLKTALPEAAKLAQFARVDVHFALPDDETYTLAGDVVTVVPGQAIAVQWRPDARPELERLLAVVVKQAPAGAAGSDEPVVTLMEDAPSSDVVMPVGDRESLQARLEAMSVQDKRTEALHGRKDMRWLLIRDHNKSVHPFVVKNPAITLDEIEQIARLTGVNPEVLHTIAHNRDWTRSQNVCRNLIKNPKTPMPDALSLLDKLPIGEVRALAKSPSVRAAIQMAARKKINNP
jgi:hypothetical protein